MRSRSQFEILSLLTEDFYRKVIAKRDTPPSTCLTIPPALALPHKGRAIAYDADAVLGAAHSRVQVKKKSAPC